MELDSQALFNLSKNGSTHIKQTVEVNTEVEKPLVPYADYINSAEWAELKTKSLHVWGKECLVCRDRHSVDRHHLFYRDRIEEGHPAEIIPLCRKCHDAAHANGENKNSKPAAEEGLVNIINRLFYQIVRVRNLPTSTIGASTRHFWRVFRKYTKAVFHDPERKIKIKNVKTTYKLRPGYDKQKKNKGRRRRKGKWKKFTPDEVVVKSNKRNKGCGFRVYPRFKTIKNYQAVVAATEFVPTYNLIKAEKVVDTESPNVWFNHPTGGTSNSLDSPPQGI